MAVSPSHTQIVGVAERLGTDTVDGVEESWAAVQDVGVSSDRHWIMAVGYTESLGLGHITAALRSLKLESLWHSQGLATSWLESDN